ncbi:hypothetical protein PX699_13055 [Sphingobium sp. H39-3-25]|uniref:hypothetical protein n=1 Tax=Sphingobium arseniciresistens TaxID=3030834 RepID=UPI0023BA2604|nr:hypothetical protein [Sphingobium arseniciresistens]
MRRAPASPPSSSPRSRNRPALRHWLIAGGMLGLLMILGPGVSRMGDKMIAAVAPELVAASD